MSTKATTERTVTIAPLNYQVAQFTINGTSPLVIKRMSEKVDEEFRKKYESGTKAAAGKKRHEAVDLDQVTEDCKYISQEGWEGFNAAAVRNAMIGACRTANFKMTMGRFAIFCIADGRDKFKPQIPLVKIIGKSVRQDDIVRNKAGVAMLACRPAYHDWSMKLRIRFDADTFTLQDIANLLNRAGVGGFGEGRNSSPMSNGMGWGCFEVAS